MEACDTLLKTSELREVAGEASRVRDLLARGEHRKVGDTDVDADAAAAMLSSTAKLTQ